MGGERRGPKGRRGAAPAGPAAPVRVVIVTLDAHLADAFERARAELRRDLPALELSLHVQAEGEASPAALEAARAARSGALRPQPDSCAWGGGCAYPTICRCEA